MNYYRCDGNILVNNKLISGYYGGQRLPNGILYSKPNNLGKCSHGGMFDKTADEVAKGGINKDSGYFIVSPHAHLHKAASDLAIKHTKLFFENIRNTIGDKEYAKLLNLDLTKSQMSQVGNGTKIFVVCEAVQTRNKFFLSILSIIILSFIQFF